MSNYEQQRCTNAARLGNLEMLKKLRKIKPKIHIFGHIHHGYGMDSFGDTMSINASIVDDELNVLNKPIVVNF
jgi:Icc-related predicted phosphoesterase